MRLFALFLFILIMIFFVLQSFKHLYFFQSNEYKLKNIFLSFKVISLNSIFYLSVVIFIIVFYFIFENVINTSILFGVLLIQVILNLYKIKDLEYLKKIKYTKRMIRLITTIFLLLSMLIVCSCLFEIILNLSIILSLILISLIIVLSAILIYPIEMLIRKSFICKCKVKLKKYPNLTKIGITGSYGKTSTKEILNKILSQQYSVLSTPKSYNTPMGITKTILNGLKDNHKYFICEMGARKCREIDYLCNMIDVNMGIVTSVGRQHTNTFHTIENIYNTKKELPDYIGKCKGLCVFNLNNSYVKLMYDNYIGKKIGVYIVKNYKTTKALFSVGTLYRKSTLVKTSKFYIFDNNILYAKNVVATKEGISFDVCKNRKVLFNCKCKLLGYHNVTNILLSIALALNVGVSVDNIKIALLNISNIDARWEKFTNQNGAIIINNGYNSNIDSLEFSLKSLELFRDKRKIVITPGLIDCEDDYKYNYKFGAILCKYADKVVIVKEKNKTAIYNGLVDSGFLKDNIRYASEFKELKNELNNAGDEDVYLIENDLPDWYRR